MTEQQLAELPAYFSAPVFRSALPVTRPPRCEAPESPERNPYAWLRLTLNERGPATNRRTMGEFAK
jgi:hypothetical protein